MRISFSSRKLEKQLTDERQMKQAYGDLAGRLKLRLDLLRAVNTLADVSHQPPPRRHKLEPPWEGHYAVDISGNWRLIFRPVGMAGKDHADLQNISAVEITKIVDYHKR